MTWVDLSSAFAYGTKLTSTQMQQLRDNLTAMANGDSGAPQVQTAGIADDAVTTAKIDDGAVTQAKLSASVGQGELKTSTGEVSTNGSTHLTLPGGSYGFYPQTKCGAAAHVTAQIAKDYAGSAAYETKIYLTSDGTGWVYAQQRYVTASGEIFWCFMLRNRESGKIMSAYASPDHPCFGNGGDPVKVSHPFTDFDPKIYEIIVINPGDELISLIKTAAIDTSRSILEVIISDYEISSDNNDLGWPKIEVTVGLPRIFDFITTNGGIKPIKKKIPKPPGFLCRRLIPKGLQ